jgi:ParB family transcriptional regulator, chromosome partitioning protein
MNERRGGLGRGLGALIPGAGGRDGEQVPVAPVADQTEPATGDPALRALPGRAAWEVFTPERPRTGGSAVAAVPGAYFAELPVAAVAPNPRQPRRVFDEDALEELAQSIREVGLLQPVVVREISAQHYQLVVGERRWRATKLAGRDTVPAIVRSTGDDEMLRDALLENLHRAQLNPLEEAAAYDQLLEDFACTHDQLAARIGKSRSQVTNTVRLLRLPPPVQRRVAAGVLSAGHARALLALDDPGGQDHLAQRIVAEGLSVRAVEEIVAVGAGPAPTARRLRPGRRHAPALDELGLRLGVRFDTRVKVELGRGKGRLVVEFASVEDLQRIVDAMAPGERVGLGPGEGAGAGPGGPRSAPGGGGVGEVAV